MMCEKVDVQVIKVYDGHKPPSANRSQHSEAMWFNLNLYYFLIFSLKVPDYANLTTNVFEQKHVTLACL